MRFPHKVGNLIFGVGDAFSPEEGEVMLGFGEGDSNPVGNAFDCVEAHNWLVDRRDRFRHVDEHFGEAVGGDAVVDRFKEDLGVSYGFWLPLFAHMNLHVFRDES